MGDRSSAPPPDTGRREHRSATSVLVYGASRPLVNLVLYALSERESPDFHWFDVRDPNEPPAEVDPGLLGWIDPGRRWGVDRFEGLVSDDARANAAVFELVRADEPPEILERLVEFLRLPKTVRQILTALEDGAPPGLLAVANVDRMSGSFPDAVLPIILDAFGHVGCSLFVGFAASPPRVRSRFARVVRVEPDGDGRWETATVCLESGPPISGLGLGVRVEISRIPWLFAVVRRAHART